ncbi:MAG: hypothetical protein AAF916_01225 [Planctomycetota bacterium]
MPIRTQMILLALLGFVLFAAAWQGLILLALGTALHRGFWVWWS